jgi:hypothetical protein
MKFTLSWTNRILALSLIANVLLAAILANKPAQPPANATSLNPKINPSSSKASPSSHSNSERKSRQLAKIENEVRSQQEESISTLNRISRLRTELESSENPSLILDEFADIIRSFDLKPDIKGTISESLVSSLLNFDSPEETFDWLTRNSEMLEKSFNSIKSAQGQTLYQEFFEKTLLKYTIENRTSDLIDSILSLPTLASRDKMLREIAPNLISNNNDLTLLTEITDPDLRSQAAKDSLISLDRRSYNKPAAIEKYLSKEFELVNDNDMSLISSIFTVGWYKNNTPELEAMLSKSTSGINRDRLLFKMTEYSKISEDGLHTKWKDLIKDSSILSSAKPE